VIEDTEQKTLFSNTNLVAVMLIVFFSTCVFMAMSDRHLWEPDEGRYADASFNYQNSNTWTVPYVNGVPHIDKPPLAMWLTAISIDIFGDVEWAYRVVPWLKGTLLLVVLFGFCVLAKKKELLIPGIAICGSSLLWFVFSEIYNLDMAIAFWVSVSLLLFWITYKAERYRDRSLLCSLMWVGIALGFLTKGLIAVVLPCGVIFLFAVFTKKLKPLVILLNPVGIGVSLIICLPWLLAMEKAIPGFNNYFFIHEHFQRFLSSSHRREGPIYYYLICLIGGTLPWSIAVFDKAFWISNIQKVRKDELSRFMAIWTIFIFCFFSISKSKLPGYILPVMVPFTFFLGQYWLTGSKAFLSKWLVKPWMILFLFSAALAQFINIKVPYVKVPDSIFSIILAIFFLISFFLVFKLDFTNLSSEKAVMLSAMILGVSFAGLGVGSANLNHYKSTKTMARAIQKTALPGTEILVCGTFPRTLSVYLRKPIHIIGSHGEHLFQGAGTVDGERYILTYREASKFMSKNPVFLIMVEKHWQRDLAELDTGDQQIMDFGNFGKWHLFSNFTFEDSTEVVAVANML